MTKTFKICTIFFFTGIWLLIMRMIAGAVTLSDNLSDWLFSFFVQIVGMGIVPLLAYRFWVKEDVVEGFSLRVKIPPVVYLLAVGVGITLIFLIRSFSAIWQTIAFLLGYVPTNSVGTIYSSGEVLVFSLICTAVLPAFFEELTYRGLGMAMVKDVKDERIKIVLMGLLFGLGHQFVLQTGYAFLAGVVFAFIAVKTKSIIPGMIIHFINNGFSVIEDWAEQQNNSFSVITERIHSLLFRSFGTIICVLVISAAATMGLLILINKVMKDKGEHEESTPVHYSPTQKQYIDDLFGFSLRPRQTPSGEQGVAWYEYAFLYAWVAMTVATTAFTFIWGVR